MDISFGEVIGYVISFVGGGGLMTLINWKNNKNKGAVEVKLDEIEALHDTIEKVYEPTIRFQKGRIEDLESQVRSLQEQLSNERKDRQVEMDLMNKRIIAITTALGMKAEIQIRNEKGGNVKHDEDES